MFAIRNNALALMSVLLLQPGFIAGLALVSGDAEAATPEPGLETLRAYRRVQCSLADEEPAVYGWHGRTYSRVPGEPDRLLFKVTGMNIRQCVTVNDPERGEGFRMVSREILLYLDPKTGDLLRSMTFSEDMKFLTNMQDANFYAVTPDGIVYKVDQGLEK